MTAWFHRRIQDARPVVPFARVIAVSIGGDPGQKKFHDDALVIAAPGVIAEPARGIPQKELNFAAVHAEMLDGRFTHSPADDLAFLRLDGDEVVFEPDKTLAVRR